MENKIKNICKQFNINDTYVSYEVLTSGHINTTYKVNFENKIYILQCINTYVFKKPTEVMENIFSVTSHIRNKLTKQNKKYDRYVLNYILQLYR